MEILPPRSLPPEEPIRRRHEPTPTGGTRGYRRYRNCLRWDFGFTCAFCLLHETDFADPRGLRGASAMTTEHRELQRDAPYRANDYDNCFLACRYCNLARGIKPIESREAKLLDPTSSAWHSHFELQDDHLRSRADDPDAEYTHRAYDLDDPIKVELRRFRRKVYEDRWALLEEAKEDLDWLLAQTQEMTRQQRWDEARRFLSVMRNLQRAQLGALRDLSRFRAIPRDAPATCSCSDPEELTLPPELAIRTIQLDS